MAPEQHGAFGSDATHFVRCLPRQPEQHTKEDLALLALDMQSAPDTLAPGPDAEENMFVPAGFTYFGQFIDHDLTFDTTSSFDGQNAPTNARTPRFDLDCVYGPGPIDRPEMYDATGVYLVTGEVIDNQTGRRDLPRGLDGRAVIGDPRNDENSIVSQIQAAFLAYHNAVARNLAKTGLSGAKLFNAARNHVRWTYQRILVEDYLPRIVDSTVIQRFEQERQPDERGRSRDESAYLLYVPDNRAGLPIEFAGAGYRFGHSMVRNGYMLQDGRAFPIFDGRMDAMSLVGFQPLPTEHVIRDWSRFFPRTDAVDPDFAPPPGTPAGGAGGSNNAPDDAAGSPRLQFAYRIDTSVANPLALLPASVAEDPPPSLIVRNLWRGAAFQLPHGQSVAARVKVQGLADKYLVVRKQIAADPKTFQFVPVTEPMRMASPLWFYILAEAQAPLVDTFGNAAFTEDDLLERATATATRLGPVGGRLVLEVFHGLLDSDPESYRNHPDAKGWTPLLPAQRVWDLVTFAARNQ